MSLDKKDFYGKEVTDAIKNACDTFGEPQENLEIEVVETGSTGIFGLIRKKAHIRALVKESSDVGQPDGLEIESLFGQQQPSEPEPAPLVQPAAEAEVSSVPPKAGPKAPASQAAGKTEKETEQPGSKKIEDLSQETVNIIESELLKLAELMGFPSALESKVEGNSINCTFKGEFEEELTGPDGKVLDSLQYILRKIISRKIEERVRINVDAGEFRTNRLEALKVKAVELAAQVKEDGKTQVVPALNPSERREVHMVLQEDKEIRSRSVGDGLFKKILIYKPGKGNRPGGRKRSRSKGRQKKTGQQKRQQDS